MLGLLADVLCISSSPFSLSFPLYSTLLEVQKLSENEKCVCVLVSPSHWSWLAISCSLSLSFPLSLSLSVPCGSDASC